MNAESQQEIQTYIIAVLKSVGLTLSQEMKEQLIKIDPLITIRQLLTKIKQQLNLSPTDSLFLYAYGCILNGNDTMGEVNAKFKHKLEKSGGRLELCYSEMSSFGKSR